MYKYSPDALNNIVCYILMMQFRLDIILKLPAGHNGHIVNQMLSFIEKKKKKKMCYYF